MARRSQKTREITRNNTTIQQTLEESFGKVDININLDEHVNTLVRYIINRSGEYTTFKQVEIRKNVLPKAGHHFQAILDKAARVLKNVYGYNLITLDATRNVTKEFVISNALPYAEDPIEVSTEEVDIPKDINNILLLLILSHIFMSNNTTSEVSLYAFLNSLNIDIERRHPLFGNIKDYIYHTLKNKKYLNIELDQMSKKNCFSWGLRAEKEISKHDVLNFVCKIYKDKLPNSWVSQFEAANQQQFENDKEEIN